jgi:hypothetical protein
MTKLQKQYNKAVQSYITAFEKITNLSFDYWIDGVGNNADFNTCYVFHFSDIKDVVDIEISKDTLLGWSEYLTKLGEFKINLRTYWKLDADFRYKKGFGYKQVEFWDELDKFLKIHNEKTK